MPYADAPRPDAPTIRSQASGSYWLANGEALGLANTRSDYSKLGPCSIVKVNQADYRMWIEMVSVPPTNGGPVTYGQPGAFDSDTVLGYATSTDGTAWTFRDTAPDSNVPDRILTPNSPTNPASGSTTWMQGESSVGTVLWDAAAGLWKLWGHGGNNTGPRAIYYATSTDGLSWTLQNTGQPILQGGASGAWDDNWVADARVVKVSSTSYILLYRGQPVTGVPQIGRATSSDGVSWTKTGTTPVLASGSGWDAFAVYPAALIYDAPSGHMHLWYGGDNAGDTGGQGLGYAWSDDLGVTWARSPLNPVIVPSAAGLDSNQIGDTITGYRDGNTYRIQYAAEKPTPNGLTGYFRGRLEATTPAVPVAPDLIGVGTAQWTATSGAAFSPSLPTGPLKENDVLGMILHVSSNGTFVVPAGWTKELPSAAAENNTTGQHVELWWKWAVTGESAPSISLASNAVTIVRGGVIFAVRGCPVDRSPFNLTSRQNNAANTTVNTTNISPATTPTLGIFAYAYEDDPSAATTPTGPTDQVGWTAPTVQMTALGNDAAIGISSRKWGQSGSYLTPSTTVSGGTFAASPNVAFLLAFDPVDVGPFPGGYRQGIASEMTPLMPILVQ